MHNRTVLYAGDTSLTTAASYLAGILASHGLDFGYLASDQPIKPALLDSNYALYVISDYPVKNWDDEDFTVVIDSLGSGSGLLMVGGWESFHGLAGEYNDSPLAEVLPVKMLDRDDRVNSSQPWIIDKLSDHPVVDGLPFEQSPTYVGGFNRFSPKSDSTQILSLRKLSITAFDSRQYRFQLGAPEPLLVIGSYGAGRTAAFASDVAPHWVGGFIDWGAERVTAHAQGAEPVEIGCDYSRFFLQLIRWTMGLLG